MFIIVIIAISIIMLWLRALTPQQRTSYRPIFWGTNIIGGVVLVVIFLWASMVQIPSGSVGVVLRFGAVTERTLTQGLQFKTPFIENVVTMSIKTQKIEFTGLTAASKDLQNVFTSIAINYKLDPTQAPTVYRTIGTEYMEVVAHQRVQETVKEITATFNAEDCIVKRAEVKGAITATLTTRLAERGIICESVDITDFKFSDEFTAAIEAKVVAQQRIQTAQNDLERMKVEAEQAVTIAQGQANANKILAESLSQEVLASMLYSVIGPNDKIIVIPSSGYEGGIVINP